MFGQKMQAVHTKNHDPGADRRREIQISVKKGLVRCVDLSYNGGNKNNVKGRD